MAYLVHRLDRRHEHDVERQQEEQRRRHQKRVKTEPRGAECRRTWSVGDAPVRHRAPLRCLAFCHASHGITMASSISSSEVEAAVASPMFWRSNRLSMMNFAGTSVALPGPPLVIATTTS